MADYRRDLSKETCEGLLQGRGKDRYACKVVPSIRATLVDQYDGDIHIRYQDTDVVVFKADGTIVLNSGGWHTTTTKSRINAALSGTGWYLYQKNYNWFVSNGKVNITFTDGMEVAGE